MHFRYNQLSHSLFLCLTIFWSGIIFGVSQPAAANSPRDPVTDFAILSKSISLSSASLFDIAPQGSLAVASKRFLTLPFMIQPDMRVVQGWYYTWWGAHLGIDFINGEIDYPDSWKTFDVVAAADGDACVNCIDGPGNKVWIKHTVANRVYYTYYGHLASVEPGISYSVGATPVTWGQKIGTAGNTGTIYIHLHFAVYNASRVPVDPYDLYSDRSLYYPNPDNGKMGSGNLFMSDPPPDPSQINAHPSKKDSHPSKIKYIPLRRSR